jgi:citrate lyase subunit beta / citryl-CoA lyase
MRPRRSELSTPASSRKMIGSAARSDADLVFLDLEDSVAPSAKDEARGNAIWGLTELNWRRKARAVRINGVETEYAYRDVIDIVEQAGEHLDLLIIPKVRTADHVRWADILLSQIEKRTRLAKRIGLEVLIEDAEALVNIDGIARSSDRLEALIFGPGDFAASLGTEDGTARRVAGDADAWSYARNRIVVTARAAGLVAVDGPFDRISDPDGYRLECQRAAAIGYTGKWAIHPSQVELANEAFTLGDAELARARELIAAYRAAQERGEGVIQVDGRMVDAASIRPVEDKVRQYDAALALRAQSEAPAAQEDA